MKKTKYSCLFIAILLAVSGCVSTMSLEEAKKVSLAMDEKPLVKPPRRISDILAVLNQPGQIAVSAKRLSELRANASALPPAQADDLALADFYYRKGRAEFQLGSFKQARDDLRSALVYARKTGTENPVRLAVLAEAEKDAGDFRKAVDLLQRSLKLGKHPLTYYILTQVHILMGDIAAAEKISREGYDWHRDKTRRENQRPLTEGIVLNAKYREHLIFRAMHAVLQAQGQYAEAEKYARQAVDLFRSPALKDFVPNGALSSRLDLCKNLLRQHRFLEAEIETRETLKEALGLGGLESIFTVRTVKSLSDIMMAEGRINDAEKLARAALRLLEAANFHADSHEMSSARMSLGKILSRKGNFPEAMKQFDLAREGMKEDTDLFEHLYARSNSRMLTLLKTGRFDEALRIIQSAYEWNRKNLGEKHPATIQALGLRGMVRAMMGNDRQAGEDFLTALPVLMEKVGKNIDPNQFDRAILEAYIDFLGRIYGTPLEEELGLRAADEAFRIAGYLSIPSTQTALGESSARAAASYDPDLTDLVRREQDLHKQMIAIQEVLSGALMAPPEQQDPKALDNLKATSENLTKARNTILDEINRRFPKYAQFTSPHPVTLDEVRKNLQPHEALISIFAADEKTYIWAVPQKGEHRFSVIPLGKKELAQVVARLRTALDPNPRTLGDIPPFDLIQAHDLYRKILQPVEPVWKDAKDLLVTVSGPLGNLPLSLLPTEPVQLAAEKGELFANYRQVPWLIRKASVTTLPSVNALVTLRSLPAGDPKRRAFAGFGDPIFNREQLAMDADSPANARTDRDQKTALENIRPAGRSAIVRVRGVRITKKGNLDSDKIASVRLDSLDRLPDTAAEIRSIARVLRADASGDIFLGKDFSLQRLRKMNLADRRVIAFATHALVPGDLDGLDQPALALSSPEITGEKGDGLLTTNEILKMKLNADWVVLSACNTGAAEGQGAEAVSGMGKAFFYAGTRALLVSMWSVETTSARKLVTGTFQAQEENKSLSRTQALRKSMLDLIDRENLKDDVTGKIVASYAHPLFWAPFVIVGDPGKSLQ